MGALIPNFVWNPILAWLNYEPPRRGAPLCDFDHICKELRACDVILVEGRARVSNVIKTITQSPWSHAALYLGRIREVEDPALRRLLQNYYDGDPETQLLVESQLGLGTVVRPVDVYANEHLRICRPSGLSKEDALRVERYAIGRLGHDYDVRQIFDLMRFLFPWSILPRRWRSVLFNRRIGRDTRTVCSTMIAEAFALVQYPILPLVKADGPHGLQLFRRNPLLFTPRDFDYSPYFKIIKYPFVKLGTHREGYRLLPWSGHRGLNDEELDQYMDPDIEPDFRPEPPDTPADAACTDQGKEDAEGTVFAPIEDAPCVPETIYKKPT